MAEALYRKYRPQIFEDVVGQEHIERTIKNAIAQDKLSHAYLFTGPRGTGKTTTARLLAKALLCEKGPTAEPDGTCADCQMIANGEHPDVYELDAASRTGVENVREEIIGRVQFAPTRGRYKIYIIDEVHMLSTAAFNALLKTLEEPPSHVVFILATTDPQKVPETIHSRCQRFDFRRISLEAIVSRLGAICVAEGVEFEGEALDLVAHRAEGGMRNALTSLEQLIAFGEGRVTLEVAERMLGALDSSDLHEIVKAVGERDVAACFRWTAQYVETGADLAQFTRDFAEHVRNMYVMRLAGADVALEVGEAARRELAEELKWFGPDRLARLLGVLGDLSAELKTSTNPRLSFEIALTRMVRPDSDLTLAGLAERIEALESGCSAVAHVSSATSAREVAFADAPAAFSSQSAPAALKDASCTSDELSRSGFAGDVSRERGLSEREARVPQLRDAEGESGAELCEEGVQEASRTSQRAEPEVAASALPPFGRTAEPKLAELKNPAALQRVWQAALASLKKEKAAYGVLFMNAKAAFDEASDSLIVEFPVENSFAYKAVQKPEIGDALQAAIARACGAAVPFRLVQAGSASVAASAAPATASAASAVPAVVATATAAPASASTQPVHQAQPQPAHQTQPQSARQPERQFQQPTQPPQAHSPQPVRSAQPVWNPPEPDPVPYDEVPLDVYDSYAPYDEEPVREHEAPMRTQTTFAVAAPATSTSSVAASASNAFVASELVSDGSSGGLSSGDSAADLQAILAQSFGAGVVFQEVKE